MNSMSDEAKVEVEKALKLGAAVERLYRHKDFEDAILEAFIKEQRLDITKGFEGSEYEVEMLKAIATFESWLENTIQYAKTLQGELND
jgi:hypothetical protein